MSEPASNRQRVRAPAGVLLFIVCCLLSSLRLVYKTPNPLHIQVDDVARQSDARFAALKAELPSNGVVGYIGEPGNAGTEEYYRAQYALAPLVVERSKDHPLVILSISTLPPKPDTTGLELLKNFGNGVLLFSNKDAK